MLDVAFWNFRKVGLSELNRDRKEGHLPDTLRRSINTLRSLKQTKLSPRQRPGCFCLTQPLSMTTIDFAENCLDKSLYCSRSYEEYVIMWISIEILHESLQHSKVSYRISVTGMICTSHTFLDQRAILILFVEHFALCLWAEQRLWAHEWSEKFAKPTEIPEVTADSVLASMKHSWLTLLLQLVALQSPMSRISDLLPSSDTALANRDLYSWPILNMTHVT